jgi:hypothetical protein
MSDKPITAAGLRIVVNNSKAISPKPRKAKREFAQIDLDWLGHPVWRKGIAPHLRIYLLLQFLTKRGTRSWKLTNAEAAQVGVSRQHKYHALRRLTIEGIITSTRSGRHTSEITLVLVPGQAAAR